MKPIFFLFLTCGLCLSPQECLVTWVEWEEAFRRGARLEALWEKVAAMKPRRTEWSWSWSLKNLSVWQEPWKRPWFEPEVTQEIAATDGAWRAGGSVSLALPGTGFVGWKGLPFSASLHGEIRLAASGLRDYEKTAAELWDVRRRREEGAWKNKLLDLFLEWAAILRRRRFAEARLALEAAWLEKMTLRAQEGQISSNEKEEARWEWESARLEAQAAAVNHEAFLRELLREGAGGFEGKGPDLSAERPRKPSTFTSESAAKARVLRAEKEMLKSTEAPLLVFRVGSERSSIIVPIRWEAELGLRSVWNGAAAETRIEREAKYMDELSRIEEGELATAWDRGWNAGVAAQAKGESLQRRLGTLERRLAFWREEHERGTGDSLLLRNLERERLEAMDALGEAKEAEFEAALRLKILLDAAGELW